MYLSEDARLALGLVLILRCAGSSPLFRCHPILDPFFAVCPEYLDSLFDVVTQTPDPCLSLVAEIVLLPHRFPLAFDSLGLCLPVLWSAYRLVLRRSAYFPPSRLVSLASCLHVVSNRLLGARLLAVLPARGPAMAAQPPSVRSAGRSRTPPPARSREPRLPWVLVCFFFADGLSLSMHQFVLCPSGTCLLACCKNLQRRLASLASPASRPLLARSGL